MDMEDSGELFEQYRPELFRLAYSMLGRIAPAKDAVQEIFLRWQKQDPDQIQSHRAYLSRIVSNLCLDELKSAKSRREQYIGPNLPEPLLSSASEDPHNQIELSESLSMALLFTLEQLSPVQRAVFLLREVFDYDYASIAEAIDKTESHCRKIAQRSRDQVKANRPTLGKHKPNQHELVTAFIEAVQKGNISEIESMLAEEAILYSDGGGKVTAARKPIYGANKIARFMVGIQKQKGESQTIDLIFRNINGEPGMMIYLDNKLFNVWSFHTKDGRIENIFVVLNPDKLRHLPKKLEK